MTLRVSATPYTLPRGLPIMSTSKSCRHLSGEDSKRSELKPFSRNFKTASRSVPEFSRLSRIIERKESLASFCFFSKRDQDILENFDVDVMTIEMMLTTVR